MKQKQKHLISDKLENVGLPDFTICNRQIGQVRQTSEVIRPKLRLEKENVRALNVQSFGGFDARNFGRVTPEVEDPEVTVDGRGFDSLPVQNASGRREPNEDEQVDETTRHQFHDVLLFLETNFSLIPSSSFIQHFFCFEM